MKRIEIFEGNWSINDVKNNPTKYFVYGDNVMNIGKGGQAIIRDLKNSIGIRTKKAPSNKPISFFRDDEFVSNCNIILEDILKIKSLHSLGHTIVFSQNGYGTGLASLEDKAPKTFDFLCECLKLFFQFDNKTGKSWKSIPSFDEINFAKYVKISKEEKSLMIPTNNSFFREDFLKSGIINYFDLIKTEKKVAFTSKTKYNQGDILILNVLEELYLVVRVSLSYKCDVLNNEQWSIFEGFNNDFIKNKNLSNFYQTHFQFICTLDEKGNMIFNDDLFVNEAPVVESIPKIVGTSSLVEVTVEEKKDDNLESVKRLLEKKSLSGEIKRMPEDGSNKIKYQIKSSDTYYAIEYKKFLIWDSISILLTSKNPFI